jgi:glycerophosphoryl diester phosphodiesterase
MQRCLPLLLLALVSACDKPAAPGPSAHRPPPLIIAHRGASGTAPENTLRAFKLAFEQGADGIEGDFHLTKDGRIVCLHDEDTERVAGTKRLARECTLAELQELDVGSWKAPGFRGERMPTLEEVMAVVPPGKRLFLEVKCGPEIVPALVKALESGPLAPSQTTIIAFNPEVVRQVKARLPACTAHWLAKVKPDPQGAPTPSPQEILSTIRRIRADGFGFSAEPSVDASFVSAIKKAGLWANVWTVDDAAVAGRFFGLGVDSITTNLPGPLREALSAGR